MRKMLKIMLLMAVFLVALSVPAFAQTTTNPDDYTPPPSVGGEVVTRGSGTAAGQLPYTGSNNTPSLVFIGLATIAAGGVIVVAARRRSQVLTRA